MRVGGPVHYTVWHKIWDERVILLFFIIPGSAMISQDNIAKRDTYIFNVAVSMLIVCGSGNTEWKGQRVFVAPCDFGDVYSIIRLSNDRIGMYNAGMFTNFLYRCVFAFTVCFFR